MLSIVPLLLVNPVRVSSGALFSSVSFFLAFLSAMSRIYILYAVRRKITSPYNSSRFLVSSSSFFYPFCVIISFFLHSPGKSSPLRNFFTISFNFSLICPLLNNRAVLFLSTLLSPSSFWSLFVRFFVIPHHLALPSDSLSSWKLNFFLLHLGYQFSFQQYSSHSSVPKLSSSRIYCFFFFFLLCTNFYNCAVFEIIQGCFL